MIYDFKTEVWTRARVDPRYHPARWRVDPAGRFISWFAYGDRNDTYGWEIGHRIAKADGGSDDISNLQAEHWQTNLAKEEARRARQSMQVQQLLRLLLEGSQPREASLGKPFGNLPGRAALLGDNWNNPFGSR